MHRPLLLALLVSGMIPAEEIQCPKSIEVRQVAVDVPSGWTAGQSRTPVQFTGVTFFDGRPEEEASLVYDRREPYRGSVRATWAFHSSSSIWLACNYTGTSVTLSRPLPNVRRCTVLYKRDQTIEGLPVIERIDCR